MDSIEERALDKLQADIDAYKPKSPHPAQANIDALRKLLDWTEDHPDLYIGTLALPMTFHASTDVREFPKVARALGHAKKEIDGDGDFALIGEFGPHTIKFFAPRGTVCTKKVVGTKVVPATPEQIIPAQPERVEEVVEWECPDSILRDNQEVADDAAGDSTMSEAREL